MSIEDFPAMDAATLNVAHNSDSVEAENRAYKESAKLPLQRVAGYLLGTVGQRITALGVGLSDARPVRAWAEGGEIREENEGRLRLLYRVARTVALIYDEETARAFLRSSSPYLEDRAPVVVIAEGDEPAALAALREFLEG
jgi:uncharacterized protein (DUF2384 family)